MTQKASPNSRLQRVAERPDPAAWTDEELLTFAEAAALLFPRGPMTERRLRTAAKNGQLGTTEPISGNIFTTKAAIAEMCRCSLRPATSAKTRPAAAGAAVPEQTDPDSHHSYVLAKLAEKKSPRPLQRRNGAPRDCGANAAGHNPITPL